MSLTIQDFALYLGAPCQINKSGKPNQVSHITSILGTAGSISTPFDVCKPDEITPILRPLSSLTEAEARELFYIVNGTEWNEEAPCLRSWAQKAEDFGALVLEFGIGDSRIWRKLLEWHFDLFGWIEKGLAIKAETV